MFSPPTPPCLPRALHRSAATPVPDLSVGDMTFTPESQASVSVSAAGKADSWEGDLLVLLAFQQEDKKALAVLAGAGAEAADKGLEGAATDMISTQEFKVRVIRDLALGRERGGSEGRVASARDAPAGTHQSKAGYVL